MCNAKTAEDMGIIHRSVENQVQEKLAAKITAICSNKLTNTQNSRIAQIMSHNVTVPETVQVNQSRIVI